MNPQSLADLLPCPWCRKPPTIGALGNAVMAGHSDATAIECSSDLHDCPPGEAVSAIKANVTAQDFGLFGEDAKRAENYLAYAIEALAKREVGR